MEWRDQWSLFNTGSYTQTHNGFVRGTIVTLEFSTWILSIWPEGETHWVNPLRRVILVNNRQGQTNRRDVCAGDIAQKCEHAPASTDHQLWSQYKGKVISETLASSTYLYNILIRFYSRRFDAELLSVCKGRWSACMERVVYGHTHLTINLYNNILRGKKILV